MTTERILEKYAKKAGWNTDSQLALLLQYIENQKDPITFEAFISEACDNETNVPF